MCKSILGAGYTGAGYTEDGPESWRRCLSFYFILPYEPQVNHQFESKALN